VSSANRPLIEARRTPSIDPTFSPTLSLVVVSISMLVFAGLTVWLAASLNIWQDEWYSLRTTSRDLGFAWTTALRFEGIPPLYPVILDLWRHGNSSVLFARLLSILCVAATAFVGWRFARRNLPRVPPAAVAAAIAFNPFSIFAAVEIRLYAMALLLSAAVIAAFFTAFVEPAPKGRDRVFFAIVATLAVYVQYFNAALLLGGFVALALIGRWRSLRAYAVTLVLVVGACSPIAFFITEQLGVPRSLDTLRLDLAPLFETAFSFAFPHEALVNWFSDRRNVLYDAGVALVVASIAVGHVRLTTVARATLGFIAAAIAFFPVATIVLHQTFVYPRHAVILLVPMLLFVFAILDGLTRRRTFALCLYVGVYAACTTTALVVTYSGLAKPGDFGRAASFISEHVRHHERVYAFDQEMVGPLEFYYTGPSVLVPLPEPQRFDRFDAERFRFHSASDVRARLGSIAQGTHVLLYRGDVCFDPADQYGCRFLEDVVRQDYRTIASLELVSANIRELVRL